MAKRNKLAGVDAAQVAKIASKSGQAGAAREYGVSQMSISDFLRKHNYQAVTVYLKDGETVTISETGASVPFQMAEGQS